MFLTQILKNFLRMSFRWCLTLGSRILVVILKHYPLSTLASDGTSMAVCSIATRTFSSGMLAKCQLHPVCSQLEPLHTVPWKNCRWSGMPDPPWINLGHLFFSRLCNCSSRFGCSETSLWLNFYHYKTLIFFSCQALAFSCS